MSMILTKMFKLPTAEVHAILIEKTTGTEYPLLVDRKHPNILNENCWYVGFIE